MNYKLGFWVVNVVSAASRLLIIGKIGLTVDEAHYWVYSKFLDFSYFDHPPLIGYIIKASTLVFGNNEFAVRFPTVLIFFFATWIFFICAKKLYNERTAFFGILLLNVLPVFSFLGSVIAVPDSPLALFWLLSLLIFAAIIETSNKNYWYLLGITIGFAMLSKYNGVLIPFSVFLFLLFSPKHRFWFKKKEPYFGLILSAVIFSPVIIWNIENSWASFGFQLNHGFGSSLPKFSLTLFGRSVGAQAGYASPLLFLIFIASAFLCVKETYKKKDRTALIVSCFSLPVLVLFNAIATFNEILPHWPATGYLVLAIYVAHLTLKFWHIKWFKFYSYTAWGLALFMTIIAPLHVLYGIIPVEKFMPKDKLEKIEYGIPESERIDVTNEVYGWKEVGNEIRRIVNSYSKDERPFIFTYKSYLASELSACVPELRVLCISDKIDAYDFWQRDLRKLKNKNGLYICNDYFFSEPKNRYGTNVFSSYTEIEEFPVYRNGKKIKNFFFTFCKSFNPSKLPQSYATVALGTKKALRQELLKFDYSAFKFINSNLKSKFLDFFAAPISYFDAKNFNLSFFITLTICIFILWKNKKEHFWTNLALMASVMAIGSVIVHFLKHYFERPRPLQAFDGNINVIYEKLYTDSFPSGHTELAFSLCAFMFIMVKKYWYLYILFVFFSGFYRIYAGSHFPSDVLVGALIGVFSAYTVVALFRKYSKTQ
ncbi:MAG: glycosyltransferase family 39 protein [Endomicrobium sp.]|jgi:4-amino-4-deoxy-L-arabinose transferase-like glycosyltransferase|nr:glycosyltransferase family 39 protein [Endomicrobium sp.]